MTVQLPHGSRKNHFSKSDAVASVRTSVLVIIGAAVAYFGAKYFGDGFPEEVQQAVVVVVTFLLTVIWKFVTDTTRTSVM